MASKAPRLSPVFVAVCLAALVRAGMIGAYPHRLLHDPDAYGAIAETLAAGHGFGVGPGHPTAYRPPLYPLVLSPFMWLGDERWLGIGALHVALGALSVWLTYQIAQRLGLGGWSYAAAAMVAVDPLSVYHASVLMSETLFTFLLLVAVWAVLRMVDEGGIKWAAIAGALLGLAALCRPTAWAVLGVIGLWNLFRRRGTKESETRHGGTSTTPARRASLSGPLETVVLCVTAMAVASPWAIRNWLVFGEPILTTTHGGYTLLLGNNDVYYADPLDPGWGVDSPTLEDALAIPEWRTYNDTRVRFVDWRRSIDKQTLGLGEPARNRYLHAEAWSAIARHPGSFLLSCLLRELHFWRPIPRTPYPALAKSAAGFFYVLVYVFFLAGLCKRQTWRPPMVVLPLLILSFMLVHAVYWTDMRMRTPVMPAVAVLAAWGLRRISLAWEGRRATVAR